MSVIRLSDSWLGCRKPGLAPFGHCPGGQGTASRHQKEKVLQTTPQRLKDRVTGKQVGLDLGDHRQSDKLQVSVPWRGAPWSQDHRAVCFLSVTVVKAGDTERQSRQGPVTAEVASWLGIPRPLLTRGVVYGLLFLTRGLGSARLQRNFLHESFVW